jgi:hypothetical protein
MAAAPGQFDGVLGVYRKRINWDKLVICRTGATLAERGIGGRWRGLGPGPHRSGDIAEVLRRKVQSVVPIRSNLIS